MTAFVYLGIQISLKRARLAALRREALVEKDIDTTCLMWIRTECRAIEAELELLIKMQNAIPDYKR